MDYNVGWQSFAIVFREGFEALLVIFGLELFLTERARVTWEAVASSYARVSFAFRMALLCGTAIALLFALPITALAINEIRAVFYNDWVRLALVASIAVFILILCATFEHHASFPKSSGWERRIKSADFSPWMIALAAGIVVYREGIETILFMVGVIIASASSSPVDIGAGIAAGSAGALLALGSVYWGLRIARDRVPIRGIMLFISAMLFWLGMHFVGSTVKVLQALQLVPATVAGDWTAAWYANWEMFAAEAVVGSALLVLMLSKHWRRTVGG